MQKNASRVFLGMFVALVLAAPSQSLAAWTTRTSAVGWVRAWHPDGAVDINLPSLGICSNQVRALPSTPGLGSVMTLLTAAQLSGRQVDVRFDDTACNVLWVVLK
jgi:hypothetical protein